jgi:hypothetical protein
VSYRVTAPLVLARDKEGKVHERYQDAVIDWLDDDQERHFLEAKLVEQVASPTVVEDDDGPPAKTALKEDWVAFAVSKGADEAEADGLTKQELQDLYGE